MNTNFRNFIRLIAVIGAVAGAPSANAIDRYRFTPLPHLGNGGEALGVPSFRPADDGTSTVGQVRDAQGNTHASLWREKADAEGLFALTLLPGLGGQNSAARTSIIFDDGTGPHSYVVGEAQTPGGIVKPVFWMENADGSFTTHVLPTPPGASGTATSIRRCMYPMCGGYIIAGTTHRSDGTSRATLWHQYPNGTNERTIDLGTLGGSNSEARGLLIDFTSAGIVVVGSAHTPSGAWHASTWEVHDDGELWSSAVTDRHPIGVSSMFQDGCGDGSHLASGAARTATGRSIAGYSDMIADGGGWTALIAPGFHNTFASACDGTTYGNLTVGQAWNDPANPQTVVWNTINSASQTIPYGISMIVDSAAQDVGTINLIRAAGPGIMVGSIFDETGMELPMALIADGTELPDTAAVVVGEDGNGVGATDLWRNDGNALRIRTRNADGDRASLQVSFYLAEAQDGSGTDNANIRARIVGSDNATARAQTQVYNFDTGMWDTVGTHTSGLIVNDWVENFAAAGHVNPDTGEVRFRVDFTPLTGKVRGVVIESLTLAYEG